MKKYIVLLVVLLACLPAFAQKQKDSTTPFKLLDSLRSAVAAVNNSPFPSNENALKYYTLIEYAVKTSMDPGNQEEELPTRTQDKSCKMYAIDKKWVIGSIKCIGTAKLEYDQDNIQRLVYSRVINNDILFADFNVKVPAKEDENFFTYSDGEIAAQDSTISRNKGLFLIYIGQYPQLTSKLSQVPFPYIYISPKNKNIFSLFADGTDNGLELQIFTSMGLVDAARTRTLVQKSYANGYFRINSALAKLTPESSDPLFIKDTKTKREYLAGFNAGDMYGTNKALSRGTAEETPYFYDFHEGDYEFIQRTVLAKDPAAWKRISKRIVNKIIR